MPFDPFVAFVIKKKGGCPSTRPSGTYSSIVDSSSAGTTVQPAIQLAAGAGATAPMNVTASKKPSFGG